MSYTVKFEAYQTINYYSGRIHPSGALAARRRCLTVLWVALIWLFLPNVQTSLLKAAAAVFYLQNTVDLTSIYRRYIEVYLRV